MRICKTCKINKPIDEFAHYNKFDIRRGRNRPYISIRWVCKSCVQIVDSKRQKERMKDPIKRAAHIERLRNNHLIKSYGVTIEDKNKMSIEQENKCAICKEVKPLIIDHNHETNELRALLCQSCNKLLGNSFESIFILQSAIEYIQEYNSPKNTQQLEKTN